MSYDLYLRPRVGAVDRERLTGYFASRPHYQTTGDRAWYRNEDTGTYFVFEYLGDTAGATGPADEGSPNNPLNFNLNDYRPSYFGREAEPEVQSLIRSLDLLVEDPQTDGMGSGEYVPGEVPVRLGRGQ